MKDARFGIVFAKDCRTRDLELDEQQWIGKLPERSGRSKRRPARPKVPTWR